MIIKIIVDEIIVYKAAFEIAVRCARELNGTPELKEAYREAQKDNRALGSFMDFCLQKAAEETREENAVEVVAEIANHLIDNGVTVQRWIPAVPKSMPKLYEPVLVKYLNYNDGTASPTNVDVAVLLAENAWYWWEGDVGDCDEDAKCTITHWMPLPKEEN